MTQLGRSLSPIRLGAAIAVTVLLASCGGSDDGTPAPVTPPTTPVSSNTPPASASATSDGFIAYLKTIVPTKPDTTDPLDVATFVAPTSTGDPDPSI